MMIGLKKMMKVLRLFINRSDSVLLNKSVNNYSANIYSRLSLE